MVVFRTDRIGDLVLTLPAIAALARSFPAGRVSAVVAPRTRDIVDGQPFLHEVFTWDGRTSTGPLIRWLRDRHFDAAILFYPRPRLAWAVWRARIPVRVGTGFRWYSALLNRRIRLRRKGTDRHEVEHSLDLIAPLGVKEGDPRLVPLVVSRDSTEDAALLLGRTGVEGGYAVVHPVGGGSALNASPAHWGRIASAIEKTGVPVLVTGTLADAATAAEVLRAAGMSSRRFVSPARLATLAAILGGAQVVVGPSTGPMHMAAAMGRPTVTLFSPVRSQGPGRWRPYHRQGAVLLPEGVTCRACLQGRCRRHHPMDTITPDRVLEAVRQATNA